MPGTEESQAALRTASEGVGRNRALPPWAIDKLLFGVSKYAASSKIWGRLVSIAMSAQSRGWSQAQFVNEVVKVERRNNVIGQKRLLRHKLWVQFVECSNDESQAIQQLHRAWAQATENRMNQGFRTAEDLIADAVERAWMWEDRLTEGKDGLSDNEARVMSYVIAFVEKRQMTRVTCPAREVAEFAVIPKSTAARILKVLAERGFLLQFSRGVWSKDASQRRAAIYSLGDPLSLRYGGRGAASERPYIHRNTYPGERHSPRTQHLLDRGGCVWGQEWPRLNGT